MGARSSQSRGPGLNETDGHLLEYFRNTFAGGGGGTNTSPPPPPQTEASGGVVSDYAIGPLVYRTHIFTGSGTLNVTGIGDLGGNAEYLVVAGGGGGGHNVGGGGGAGGLRTNLSGHPLAGGTYTLSAGSYTVTVGAGGIGDNPGYPGSATNGGDSNFFPTPVSHPSPTCLLYTSPSPRDQRGSRMPSSA